MGCLCDLLGQRVNRFLSIRDLRKQRYIVGWTCQECSHQWISIHCNYDSCPQCQDAKITGRVSHTICTEHGCRGPESVWVSEKMLEAKIPCAERSVDYYVQKLKSREPFTHARYGDGDWLTAFGYHNLNNSNGCKFTKKLGAAVRQVLKNQHDYDHVLLNHPNWRFGMHIADFLKCEGIEMQFASEWMLPAMLGGKLLPLFEQIRNYRAVYVGPHDIDGKGFFPLVAHLKPPPQNAFNIRYSIVEDVITLIENEGVDFIGWSSGGGCKPMIDDVYAATEGEITQIDFGCAFDGFFPPLPHVNPAGSRKFIRKDGHDWEELLRMNTEGV